MMPTDSKKLTVEDALLRRGDFSKTDEEFMKLIEEKQDERFTDIRSLVFGWKPQPDGSKKLMSRLPNGKVVFVDRREQFEVKPGRPYLCLVYEREREAFARILCEEQEPVIWVLQNKLVTLRYVDKNGQLKVIMPHGKTYQERILAALNRLERLGFPEIKVVFRENERKAKQGE